MSISESKQTVKDCLIGCMNCLLVSKGCRWRSCDLSLFLGQEELFPSSTMIFNEQDRQCDVTLNAEILRPCCVSLLAIPRIAGRKPYAALQAGHTGARLLTCPRHGRVSPTRHRGCLWEAQALRV